MNYMAKTGDLRWGIAAVNLRPTELDHFKVAARDVEDHDGYFLKSYSFDGQVALRRVRSHVAFHDWHSDVTGTQNLLALNTVHLVTITVTESGYYTDPNGALNPADALIAKRSLAIQAQSVYAYLRAGLSARINAGGAPLTIACCDNIRQNGKMLSRNLLAYLTACGDIELANWVGENVAFPCSMVDRITPRTSPELGPEISTLVGADVLSPIMAEDFTQWVLQKTDTGPMPALDQAGVTITPDVDPFEETKIRVLTADILP